MRINKSQNVKTLESKIRKIYRDNYNDYPCFDIIHKNQLEIHTGGWMDKTKQLGFIWIKEGYFSDIYQIPESIINTK